MRIGKSDHWEPRDIVFPAGTSSESSLVPGNGAPTLHSQFTDIATTTTPSVAYHRRIFCDYRV